MHVKAVKKRISEIDCKNNSRTAETNQPDKDLHTFFKK